jgi:hypothetical protein
MAANQIEIEVVAKDSTGRTLSNIGRNISNIGNSLSNTFTRPLADLGRLILKNEEVQKSLEPLKTAYNEVFGKLADAAIPIIERLTPALITLSDELVKLIDQFMLLDVPTQNAIIGFIGVLAVLGPVLTTVGQAIMFVGMLTTAWTTLSGFLAPIISVVFPAIVAALGAITAPVWLLIGAIALLGAAFIIFGDDARNSVYMIIKILETLIKKAGEAIAKLNIFKQGAGTIYEGGKYPGIVGHATGGFVSAGIPSMVGELGPEIFVPKTSGRIIPNNKIGSSGSGGQVVNNYYSFPGMVTLGTQADLERNLGPVIKKLQRQSA